MAATARAGRAPALRTTHADTATLLRHPAAVEATAQVDIPGCLTERGRRTGIDHVAVTPVAGHLCINAFQAVSPFPAVDLLEVVQKQVQRRALKRAGPLGARGVMASRLQVVADSVEAIALADDLLRVHEAWVEVAMPCSGERFMLSAQDGKAPALVHTRRAEKESRMKPLRFVMAWLLFAGLAQAAPQYRVVELGAPPGVAGTYVYGLNNLGQAVGLAQDAVGTYAVAWSAGDYTMRRLPGAVQQGYASAINDAGVIVGSGTLALQQQAILWTVDGSVIGLGRLPGGLPQYSGSLAYGINSGGTLVGLTYIGGAQRIQKNGDFAYRWDAGAGMTPLPDLPRGLDNNGAYGINDGGDIVGYGSVVVERRNSIHAVLWSRDGSVRDLGTLGTTDTTIAFDINNAGQVVGRSAGRPMLWTAASGMKDLGLPPRATAAEAYAINDAGQCIGHWYDLASQVNGAFYWHADDGILDLADLVDPADPLRGKVLEKIDVSDINLHGVIIANIGGVVSPARAVLLVPSTPAKAR
jgi:uncharacterized membrane protein